MRSNMALDTLCKRYREVIKEATRFSNRRWAVENMDDKDSLDEFDYVWHLMTDGFTSDIHNRISKGKRFTNPDEFYDFTEKRIQNWIASQAELIYPKELFEWLACFNGLKSGTVRFELINHIGDIAAFDSVAKLWRFAGYGIYWYWDTGKNGMDNNVENTKLIPLDGWKFKGSKGKDGKDGRKAVWTVCCPWETYDRYPSPYFQEAGKTYLKVEEGEELMPFCGIEREVVFIKPDPDWKFIKHRDVSCSGYARPYNVKLKTTLHLIADQFMRHKAEPYRSIYDQEKQRQLEKGLAKGHAHNRGVRKMKKEFLKHLWLYWRQLEGLPITEEY